MGQPNPEFIRKLLATFEVEAAEYLRAMSRGLVELEQASSEARRREVLETVFREAHSLKGAARAVNLTDVEALCRSLEDVFSALKAGRLAATPPLFDRLHAALGALAELLPAADGARPKKVAPAELIGALESHLSAAEGAPAPEPQPQPRPSASPHPDAPFSQPASGRQAGAFELPGVVRVSTAKLNSLMLQAEEFVAVKLALAERAAELRQLSLPLEAWEKRRRSLAPDVRRLDRARAERHDGSPARGANGAEKKLLEYLDWNGDLLRSLEAGIGGARARLERDARAFSGMADRLLADVKASLMLPFSVLLEPFPALVRGLARDRQKEVELTVHDAGIEVDRRVLEEMKAPLMHLVRNAVDHGIETPPERRRRGKPPRGSIVIALSEREGGKFELAVSDDGAGIDVSRVRASAQKLGLVSPEEDRQMDDPAASRLVFRSGVSASPILTDLSGRGLGLAIVEEKVRSLGGSVSLESHPGRGACFRMLLPVTLAAFRGVRVRLGERAFVLPTAHVERVARLHRKDVKTVENRETIPLEGAPVSLVRLASALGIRDAGDSPETFYVVVLESDGRRVAFQVDEIVEEQEVLVKALGPALARLKGISGAAVLGTGQLVPVLSAAELVKGAAAVAPERPAPPAAKAPEPVKRSVLVAEDSITARTLLKNILESAGFNVQTAVDGMDAYTILRTEKFDLVVSDVDMPRMSGFELTAKIRADQRLKDLPVVLVTALESREDRERGVDVGASAYIVKSSFDQGNLLEVVRRLI